MKLPPRWRKALLTVHVVTAVGWLGVDLVLLTLGVAGLSGVEPDVVYPALGFVGRRLFAPLSVLAWVVGVLSSLLTPWGLVRHRWVVVKLVITTVMLGLVLLALYPTLTDAWVLGAALSGRQRIDLVIAPAVSSTVLLVATVLSTYKPWGRTRRGTAGRLRRSDPGYRERNAPVTADRHRRPARDTATATDGVDHHAWRGPEMGT